MNLSCRRSQVLLCGVLVAATACLPFPHTERLSPRLIGKYQRSDGVPLAGVEVALCGNDSVRAVTDSTGAFELPATYKRRAFVVVLGDQVFGYQLCAHDGRAWRSLYEWSEINRQPPPTVSVLCTQLSRPPGHAFCSLAGGPE